MPYGLKYQTQFSSYSDTEAVPPLPSKDFTLQFLFKDYTGEIRSVPGGETTVIQSCNVDDPTAPIKGQSLSIKLDNKGQSLPIGSFFSEDDDGIQVILSQGSNILFIGFLVQDDFYEPMVDYTHEIILSATDSLGLLKGVILSDAAVRRAFDVTYISVGVSVNLIYVYSTDTAFYPTVGATIELQGISYLIEASQQGVFTAGAVNYNWLLRVDPDTPVFSETTETIYLDGFINLRQRNTLLTMIATCLAQTNLSLLTNIYHNLFEYRQDPLVSSFAQTLIDSQLFISGETYMNCYDVLWEIMKTYDCTLEQANGQWNIVNWYESRQHTNNTIPGFVYDETWQPAGTTVFTNVFSIGNSPVLTRPIHQLIGGAVRGYKFARKTFNYRQPKYLLQNYDLQQVGAVISTVTIGSVVYTDYYAPGWQGGVGATLCTRVIRVERDLATGAELGRYIAMWGPNSDSTQAVGSEPIEISEGDKIKFSFSFKTNISQPGAIVIIFAVRLQDGTLTRYVDEIPAGNGTWISTVGFSYTISGGDNSNEWHSVEIESSQTPFSGQLTCFLAIATDAPYNTGRQTYYKDIRFEVTQFINDSSKVTGQIHKQEQDVNKKLNNDVELQIDDSPRNTIVGTLFLTTKTPNTAYGLQDRTLYWRYPPDANGWRLGEWSTLQLLTWKQKTRSKLEGGFIGNWQGLPVSLLMMAVTDYTGNKNYVPGLLSIDYKRNRFSCTLWEISETGEAAFEPDYSFTYIYSTE